ncbi:hypothetical protein J7L48_07870 [bacterium]|nr:hypothetical protein [bacterium]
MRKWLFLFVILLKVLISGAYFPFFLNNYLLYDEYNYFDKLALYYEDNIKLFNSENYFIKEEKHLFPVNTSLLFFNESFIHSKNNCFYLNIDLLSGKYGEFQSLRNKFVNISYSFKIKNIYLGFEGIWSETNNELPNKYYNSQNLYFLKAYMNLKNFKFIFKYNINPADLISGLNFYAFFHYKDYIAINTFLGFNPDFTSLVNFTDDLFKKELAAFQTIENIKISYPPYLQLILYYFTCEEGNNSTELTFDLYHRTFLQFFFNDDLEIKRLFFKIPITKRYTSVAGVEFNNDYYFYLSFIEKSKNYFFAVQLKNTLKMDIYSNFSIILKYIYYIH